MNWIASDATARGAPGRHMLVLAGALLASLASVGIAGRGGNPSSGPPGGFMDDEAIGSLPSEAGGAILFLSPGEPHPALSPSFYVEGPTELLLDAIVAAHGLGHLTLHPTQTAGRSLVVAYGPLHLDLDAALFAHPEVEAGLVAGAGVGRVAGAIFHEGSLVRSAYIDPASSRWELPVGGLIELGYLKHEGLDLVAGGPRAGRQRFELSIYGGVVTLHQMN